MPFDEKLKVARGAGYDEISPFFSMATTRFWLAPDKCLPSLGFRCVKDAD